jgi:hypothetical protein
MAEVIARDGTWTFDGECGRIVPGHDRGVHKLRQAVGEIAVPLLAVAGIAHESGRKGGRLRLRLRDGADPFGQAARGQLPDAADPYQLAMSTDRTGVAEYFADEVRNALLIEQVPDGPSDRYLLPGPRVPLTASAGDGTVSFDGTRVRLEWNGWTEESKKSAGPQHLLLEDLAAVEWKPLAGFENGHLRFRLRGATANPQPKHDPHCLTWGMRELGGTTLLIAAAVVARLPHPFGAPPPAPDAPAGVEAAPDAGRGEDPDALLRRLRELGDLHRDGVLTDEEFTAAKRILLRGSQP